MSAKRMRTFWPFSPCPEAHHEITREDAVIKAVRARYTHLSIEEIQSDMVDLGFTNAEVYNAIKAVQVLDESGDDDDV